jgi:hypothetical protein
MDGQSIHPTKMDLPSSCTSPENPAGLKKIPDLMADRFIGEKRQMINSAPFEFTRNRSQIHTQLLATRYKSRRTFGFSGS